MDRREALKALTSGVAALAAAPLPTAAGVRQQPGAVRPLQPMHDARAAHTLTAVGAHAVVAVGGFGTDSGTDAGAEWLDVTTGRWAALPGALARQSHSATAMGDGRVLIVGGYVGGTPTTAVETFDAAATRRFERRGEVMTARAGHIAVPMPGERLLVIGGVGLNWTFLDSVEWLDAAGRPATAAAMSVAREGHAAVRLADGRVLVCGGHRGRGAAAEIFASAELFDPATGRWTATGSMTVRRHKHDAVLLPGGQVLLIGGADERDERGAYDTTEIFEPASGVFRPGPRLRIPRYKLRGTSHVRADGRILVAGGAERAEVVAPAGGRSELLAGPPLTGQFSASVLLADGRAVVTGGYGSGRGPQSTAWIVPA